MERFKEQNAMSYNRAPPLVHCILCSTAYSTSYMDTTANSEPRDCMSLMYMHIAVVKTALVVGRAPYMCQYGQIVGLAKLFIDRVNDILIGV